MRVGEKVFGFNYVLDAIFPACLFLNDPYLKNEAFIHYWHKKMS